MTYTRRLDASTADDVDLAKIWLKEGKLVAVPTETVYGLAANAANIEAVKSIYRAKNRPANHPLIVHIGTIDVLHRWAKNIPDHALHLAKHFWPGPLTLVLKKAATVNTVVTGGLDTIALRMPAHPVLLELLKETGLGLAAPSANPYGKLSPTTATQVMETMSGKIDAVLDGGQCEIGVESTIVDPTTLPARILRSGPVSAEQIRKAIGMEVVTPEKHTEAVPGNVEAHYQPRARLRLLDREKLLVRLPTITNDIGAIVYSPELDAFDSHSVIKLAADKAAYARQLYVSIYKLDNPGRKEIWVETPPDNEEWLDINDRLLRAASSIE